MQTHVSEEHQLQAMGDLQQALPEVTFALKVRKGGSVTVSQQPGDAV